MRSPIGKRPHALSPSLITAGLEFSAHERFDLIGRQAMDLFNGCKSHVVAQGQGDDLSHTGRVQVGQLRAAAGGSLDLTGTSKASGAEA